MAENKQETMEFEFPDEVEDKGKPLEEAAKAVAKEAEPEIEIEDDTPPEDRGRQPLPKEVTERLEKDELDQYEGETKEKFKQLKKVWHDERRAKEAAYREQQEALAIAKRLMEENKALKAKVNSGQEVFANAAREAADNELALAKRDYKEAYESGDADKIIEAQERMTTAKFKAEQLKLYKYDNEALQNQENAVQLAQEQPRYTPDLKAKAWQERNSWFGQDEEMTSLALGLHEKLVKEHGMSYATTNEYYDTIDKTMRRRFPEHFEESEVKEDEPQKTNRPKASTVVAPATRSTSPKKIRLSGTQVQLAKKLGLTPEQYARELTKLEAQNG
jgi:hypothetical protein